MSKSLQLSPPEAVLLFELAEWPGLVDASRLAEDRFCKLVEEQWLVRAGMAEEIVCRACYDDHTAPIELTEAGYRHRCPEAGWVSVEPTSLARYRVDRSKLVRMVASQLGIPDTRPLIEVVPQTLWDMGDNRLSRKGGTLVSLFIAASSRGRLDDDVTPALAARRRGLPTALLVLGKNCPLVPSASLTMLSVWECRRASELNFCVAPEIVAARVQGLTDATADEVLWHSSDFSEVRVLDTVFRFRGQKQRDVVEQLFRAREAGQHSVSEAELLEGAESDLTRLRDLFRKHASWEKLIAVDRGRARLCVGELLSDAGGEQKT